MERERVPKNMRVRKTYNQMNKSEYNKWVAQRMGV